MQHGHPVLASPSAAATMGAESTVLRSQSSPHAPTSTRTVACEQRTVPSNSAPSAPKICWLHLTSRCVPDAGRWHFALDEPVSHSSTGGPLFVGSLPARQPDAYYALLPMRVPRMTKVRWMHEAGHNECSDDC